MYNFINQSGQIQYNVVELIVDTINDILTLPTNFGPGSTAFVIENSAIYMLSNAGKWEELK